MGKHGGGVYDQMNQRRQQQAKTPAAGGGGGEEEEEDDAEDIFAQLDGGKKRQHGTRGRWRIPRHNTLVV